MLVIEEKKGYGDYGLDLSKFHLNLNLKPLGAPSKPAPTTSTGWLDTSKFHLNLKMPNWLKPKMATTAPKTLTPPKRTIVPPKVQKKSFFSSISSGLGSLFHSLGQTIGQLAPTILQYKLAKDQMKMQAQLARLQMTGGGAYPAPSVPAGGMAYPESTVPQTGVPAGGAPAYYNQPQQSNMGKYLLIGGGVLAAVLLVTLMHRD